LVTPDEIQRLMSGYATGSLSDSDRRRLFDAALDDQNLFDQLAHEQALKDLIDQPGARDRLIAALAPAETPRAIGAWKKPLAWGFAAMFVVSMSIAALMLTRSGIRTQVAQRQIPQLPIAQPPATQTPVPQTENGPLSPPSPPPPATAPGSAGPSVSRTATPPRAKQAPAKRRTVDGQPVTDGKLAPIPPGRGAGSSVGSLGTISPAAVPSRAPPPAQPQTTPQSQSEGKVSQEPAVRPQGFVAGQPQGVPPPTPAPQAPQLTTGQLSNPQTQGRQDSNGPVQNARNQAQTGPDQVQSGGGGGGARGGAVGAVRAQRIPTSAPAPFAFDYSIDGEDLVFKFSVDGYFSLHIAPGGLTIVDSRVIAGSTRREHITANGTEAVIVFSASRQSDAQGVAIETRARSLTVEDPARKRIEVLVKFY
jgi:hypothetical protein